MSQIFVKIEHGKSHSLKTQIDSSPFRIQIANVANGDNKTLEQTSKLIWCYYLGDDLLL